jgi:protein TonB
LKYSLIVPLALALVLSSNAQTVVNKAKKALATKEVVTEQKTVKAFPKKMVETKQLTEPIIVNNEKADEKPYEVVEKMPQYQGGDGELLSYIVKNLKYPVIAQESGTQGKLLVRFVVNKDGKVTNASILKKMLDKPADKKGVVVVGYNKQDSIATMNENAGIALEKEALRVVNAMNNWTPGEQDGKKVAVYYILPITFKLQ